MTVREEGLGYQSDEPIVVRREHFLFFFLGICVGLLDELVAMRSISQDQVRFYHELREEFMRTRYLSNEPKLRGEDL